MNPIIIVFDLDGTLSDPVVGIAASINHALKRLGLAPRPQEALEKYIGPPLQDIFSDLLDTRDEESILEAIGFFRERYFKVGYRENMLYPGIEETLESLKNGGYTLYIATAKKESVARSVTDYFGISTCFKDVLGCGLQRRKVDLLREIRVREKRGRLIMVGDRKHDMAAGKETGCFCIGVLWGYGSREELRQSGADQICRCPRDLTKTIGALSDTPKSEEDV